MEFLVEVLEITDDKPRDVKVLATYEIEAPNLLAARVRGAELYVEKNPGRNPDIVFGKAKPK